MMRRIVGPRMAAPPSFVSRFARSVKRDDWPSCFILAAALRRNFDGGDDARFHVIREGRPGIDDGGKIGVNGALRRRCAFG